MEEKTMTPTALQRIKEIEAGYQLPFDRNEAIKLLVNDTAFLIKAFNVMKKVAIELDEDEKPDAVDSYFEFMMSK